MLIDSHCHLQDRKFEKDRMAVLQRGREAGVTGFVTIGYDMPSSRRGITLADSTEDVHAAIGVHPHDAKTVTAKDIDELDRLADSASVVAIGEIGLDFYRNLSPREDQFRAFREQLTLARSLQLPIVIHSRDADEETYQVLSEYEREALPGWPKDRPLGIMHCFAGDLPLALRYIELGFVISIPTTCTYPNADRLRAVAAGIPLRWMAIETDSPYLAPQPYRGKRNEPAYVVEAVKCIAELRGVSPDEVADRTALTAAWLFGLGEIGEPAANEADAR